MGCCFGKDEESYPQDGPKETSRLLGDPVRNSNARVSIGDGYNSMSPHSSGRDEQSALERILTQTASNVIDVTAVDNPSQELGNYHEISKMYSDRINLSLSGTGHTRTYTPELPNGVTSPQTVLAQPVSQSDIAMINSAATKAATAVSQVRIEHKENLVVPFGVP